MSIRKTYPMQADKIMHGLRGFGQMMFTKYLVVDAALEAKLKLFARPSVRLSQAALFAK